MSDLFVFDIYTGEVFGMVASICLIVSFLVWLVPKYPRIAGAIYFCIVGSLFLWKLFDIASMERHMAYPVARGNP